MTKPVGYLTNSPTGIEGEPGVFYDYILAAGGIYLRAKNSQLAVTVCIAAQEIKATSFSPSEVYCGVRFEKDGEDNGLNLPMVIIKQTACP
jgi:hypothetical protein